MPGQGLEPQVDPRRRAQFFGALGLLRLLRYSSHCARYARPSSNARSITDSTPIRVLGKRPRDRVTFSPSANFTPCGPLADDQVAAGLAVLQLDDGVLAADRIGRTVQQPGGRRSAGDGPVDARCRRR